MKFSTAPVSYPTSVQQRADDLYGTSFAERMLKDYNGQVYWLSVNPRSFMNDQSSFPGWLNIAAGYGAGGMLGGFENAWTDEATGKLLTRHDIARYRKFYFAPDLDLTRIKTESRALQLAFVLLNIVKFPAPAIEINTLGEIRFHPMLYANYSVVLN
jgi:hypothetical protein